MVTGEKIIYQDGDLIFEGFASWDTAIKGERPGILVAPTFKGQSEFENNKTTELAGMGYFAMAVDLYGQGRRASDVEEATRLMNELNHDRALLSQRINHALRILNENELVDSAQTAAIGFCFGGKCVLDLARSGADIEGVVSFHGIYDAPQAATKGSIKSAILVLHGWEDPLATPNSVSQLAKELTERNADWQILAMGHTGHAFTNPNAEDHAGGMFYQDRSNRRSWQMMTTFLKEIFNTQT